MTGKIFKESNSIYDDEARVLFDYYKACATKIVEEEMSIEEKIAGCKEDIQKAQKDGQSYKTKATVFFILTAVALIGGVVLWLLSKSGNYPSINGGVCLLPVVLGVCFLISALVNNSQKTSKVKEVEGIDAIMQSLERDKSAIRRDYKVEKLGVSYVPLCRDVPFNGKSFTVDYAGITGSTTFSLSVPNDTQKLRESLAVLDDKTRVVSAVEGNSEAEKVNTSEYSSSLQEVVMHDYMGALDREVRNIGYLLGDTEHVTVDLPVVAPGGDYDKFLDEYTTDDAQGHPVLKVFDSDKLEEKFETFRKLNEMKEKLNEGQDGTASGESNNVEYFKRLMKRLGNSVEVIGREKTYSLSKLLQYNNAILSCVLKSGYNEYSPALEAEEIARIREESFDFREDSDHEYRPFSLKPSSVVRYDLFNRVWVAEDQSRTNMPFGINAVEEEIFMPLIHNLMQETRLERLKVYNNIADQKLHYRNEWSRDVEDAFRDNRKTGQELLKEITQAYAEYNAAYQTYLSYKETQDAMKKTGNLEDSEVKERDSMAEQVALFQMQSQNSIKEADDFQDYMDRLQEDIEQKTRNFEHVEYYEASLRDGVSRDIARSIDNSTLAALEPRRQALVAVNPYYAAYANLCPEPQVEDKLNEDFAINTRDEANALLGEIQALEAPPPSPKDGDDESGKEG